MLGNSAVKLTTDLDNLISLASVLSNPEKLKSLRDELQKNLLLNQESDKQTQLRLENAQSVERDNQTLSDALGAKEIIADTREANIKVKEDTLAKREQASNEAVNLLKTNIASFQNDIAAFASDQKKWTDDFNQSQQKTQADLDQQAKILKAREDAVALREQEAATKETSLFKQSQLAAVFLKSLD